MDEQPQINGKTRQDSITQVSLYTMHSCQEIAITVSRLYDRQLHITKPLFYQLFQKTVAKKITVFYYFSYFLYFCNANKYLLARDT